MKKKNFSQKFYDEIKDLNENSGDEDIMISRDKFLSILEEEFNNYTKDSLAEVGMGIYKLIEHNKKMNICSDTIINNIVNVCRNLISNSPESAMEFSTIIGKRHGI